MKFIKMLGVVLLTLGLSWQVVAADKIEKLVLSGPTAGVSFPLIHMVETGALNDIAATTEFRLWRGPDQLRLVATGKGDFSADFVATPSNVAANLYNRGVELQLMNISIWGILWMASRDDSMKTLADFKGKNIAMPFRGDMPDIVFQHIVKEDGLDPLKDFNLHYVPTPMEAMKMLTSGRVDHALLPEPAMSMALVKAKKNPDAPNLYRSVSVQEEWGRVFQREAKIPQAGITAMKSILNNPVALQRFQEEYKKSAQWILENPTETAEMVVKHIKFLSPKAVAASLKWMNIKVVGAKEAQAELEFFYEKLLVHTPALVGGKLPDDGFYFQGS